MIPDNVIDKKLYSYVKEKVKREIPKHSAYRSMRIQRLYKDMGGRYKTGTKYLNRWLEEKWIVMLPYLLYGDIVECGNKQFTKMSACRPLYVIDKDKTPITADEVIEKHGKDKLLEAIQKKNSDPQRYRLNWHTLKITSKY